MSTTGKPKAVKAPAKPRKTPAAKSKVPPAAPAVPTHDEIALLAQKYWAERGWQDGAAEQDWLRAEQELMKIAS